MGLSVRIGVTFVALVLILGSSGTARAETTTTFYYTGGQQTLAIPSGVFTVHVTAVGGKGGGGAGGVGCAGGAPGGYGAVVSGTVSVAAGTTLYVDVAGNGRAGGSGFNGGGLPGEELAGGGGGASDVRTGTALSSRLLVAAGGGGGGEWGSFVCGGSGGAAGQPGEKGPSEPEGAENGGAGGGAGTGVLGVGGSGGLYGGGGGGGGLSGGGGGGPGTFSDGVGTLGGSGGGGGGSSLVPLGGSFAVDATGVPMIEITVPTPIPAPTAVTDSASGTTQTSATLNATVNPNGTTVSECKFEYGTTTSYGSSVPCTSLPGSGSSPVDVSASVAGLTANTTYHFRVVATNLGGNAYGTDDTLSTLPNAPAVVTLLPLSTTQTSATVAAEVNADGGTISDCHFDYGTSIYYGSSAPCVLVPGSNAGPVLVYGQLVALSANVTYHFRIVATNSGGTGYGADQTLTTLLPSQAGVLGSQEHKAPQVPDAKLASTSLTASSSGTVSVKVTCPAGESSCTGTLTLRTLTAVIAATGHQSKKSKAAILALASGSFKVAGGHVTTVKLHLSAKARALLARTHVLRARATIVAHDPAGATHTTETIVTLRAPSTHRR